MVPTDLFLDLGGSGLKFGTSGESLTFLRRVDVSQEISWDGRLAYYDMEALGAIIDKNLQELVHSTRPSRLFISSQMSCGYLRSDPVLGNRVFSWQSESPMRFQAQIREELTHGEANDLRPGSTVFTIVEARKTRRHMIETANKLDTLGGFLAERALGFDKQKRHSTDAYSMGGYRVDGTPAEYSKLLNIELPSVTKKVESLGTSVIFPGLEVFTPVGDQQASLFGMSLRRGEIALNVGTGGQIASIVSTPLDDPDLQIRPYFDGAYLATKTHMPAGRTVSSYFEFWRLKYKLPFEEFIDLARGQVSAKIVQVSQDIELNFHPGMRESFSPELLQSPEFLPRALTLAMAKEYSIQVSRMRDALPTSTNLVLGGGLGTRYPALTSMISELTGLGIRRARTSETTLQGLFFLALTA